MKPPPYTKKKAVQTDQFPKERGKKLPVTNAHHKREEKTLPGGKKLRQRGCERGLYEKSQKPTTASNTWARREGKSGGDENGRSLWTEGPEREKTAGWVHRAGKISKRHGKHETKAGEVTKKENRCPPGPRDGGGRVKTDIKRHYPTKKHEGGKGKEKKKRK